MELSGPRGRQDRRDRLAPREGPDRKGPRVIRAWMAPTAATVRTEAMAPTASFGSTATAPAGAVTISADTDWTANPPPNDNYQFTTSP